MSDSTAKNATEPTDAIRRAAAGVATLDPLVAGRIMADMRRGSPHDRALSEC